MVIITKVNVMKFLDGTVKVDRNNTGPNFFIHVGKKETDDETTVVIQNRSDERKETFSVDVENMDLPDVLVKEVFDEQFIFLFYYSNDSILRIMDMDNS